MNRTTRKLTQLIPILQAIRVNASPTLQAKIDQSLQYLNGRIGWTYKALLDQAFPP